MNYVCILPEIAGEHDEHSEFDRSKTPFEVTKLHYVFLAGLATLL
jgi:hypothetical protein